MRRSGLIGNFGTQACTLLIEKLRLTAAMGSCVEVSHRDLALRLTGFYASDPSVRQFRGASGVFDRLRSEGIRVALNTGFDRAITDVILARFGSRERINGSIASDDIDRVRPYPDMILDLTGRFDVSSPSRAANGGRHAG